MALINGPSGSSPEKASGISPVPQLESSTELTTQSIRAKDVIHYPQAPEKKTRSKLMVAVGAGSAALLATIGAYMFTQKGDHKNRNHGEATAAAPLTPPTTPETTPTTIAKREVKFPSSNDPQEITQSIYDNMAAAINTDDINFLKFVYPDPNNNSTLTSDTRNQMSTVAQLRSQDPELEYVEHVTVLDSQGFNDPSSPIRFVTIQSDEQVIKQHYAGGQTNSITYHKQARLTLEAYDRPDENNTMHHVWLLTHLDNLTPITQS